MVDPELEAEFSRVLTEWQALGRTLAELAERLAIATVAEALPGAAVVKVHGEFNEDWLRTLRIRRVLSADRTVLFDVGEDDDEPRVEAAVANVNSEYLDLRLELTGDAYMGSRRSTSLDHSQRAATVHPGSHSQWARAGAAENHARRPNREDTPLVPSAQPLAEHG